jgi:isopentenyl-diphosphate Delta-isomerase
MNIDRNKIILVDKDDSMIATSNKKNIHAKGLLHRAFSIFIFNSKNQVLLQKRALEKYHSPGLWTNTCCSHAIKGIDLEEIAKIRLNEEMGFECPLKKQFVFHYKANLGPNLFENEIDHVFTGLYEGKVNPNKNEVCEFAWVDWKELNKNIFIESNKYTVWLKKIIKISLEKNLFTNIDK